jgi:PAS domain S-box-containing protein
VLTWDQVTRSIHEVSEDFQPCIHKALSFYKEGVNRERITQDIDFVISNGGSFTNEYEIISQKGNHKYIISHSLSEFKDNVCVRIYGTFQDITVTKKLEEDLRIRESQFSNAIEFSSIGMGLVNPDGNFLRVNRSLCNLLGYKNNELLNMSFEKISHEDELEENSHLLQRLLNKEIDSLHKEKRFFHKNGDIVWATLSISLVWKTDDTPNFFIVQIKNITKRKRANEELEKERQRLAGIIDSANLGTWEWNVQTGECFFNERWANIFGYQLNEIFPVKTSQWHSLNHPEDIVKLTGLIDACFNKLNSFLDCQYRMKHKDGHWVWVHSKGKVVKWDGDLPLVMVGTVMDICDSKNKEQILKDNFDVINEQNKKLLNFAYIVSHNLRSHAGNFQILLDIISLEDDEKEKEEMMRLLLKNAENLQHTVDNLNEVVQIQTNIDQQVDRINLYNQIERLVNSNINRLQKDSINVIINVPKDLEIEYNLAYLESILLNFLTNAIKYKHPDRIAEIEFVTSYENGNLVLEVKDNGIGIDLRRNGDKIFGMYKTFHNNKDAQGIGLFITKNQIEAMGGRVSVQSEVGRGSVFKVNF